MAALIVRRNLSGRKIFHGLLLLLFPLMEIAASVSPHPNISWDRETAFQSYSIEIAKDPLFEQVIDVDNVSNVARYVPDLALEPGEYFWMAAADHYPVGSGSFVVESPERVIPISTGSGMEEIRAAIELAQKSPSSVICFEKGVYHLRPGHLRSVFEIKGMHNLIIDGQGSKLVIHDIAGVAEISDSSHITLRNFVVDYEAAVYTAARVVSLTREGVMELSLLDNCVPPDSFDCFIQERKGLFIDPSFPKPADDVRILVEMLDPWEKLGEGRYRLVARQAGSVANVKPGMVYVCAPRHGVQGFQINQCDDVALVDITTYYLPGIGVASHFANDLKLIRLNLLRREDRLLGVQNGGTNMHSARIGPWVENCRYENPGDDCNHISSSVLAPSAQPEPDVLVFEPRQSGLRSSNPDLDIRSGDKLAFFDRQNGKLLEEAIVVDSRLQENRETAVRLDRKLSGLVLKERASGISKTSLEWTQVYNLDRSCGNFVFRGNTFLRGRRIGILAKSGPGLIENNRFIELGAGGVDLWNAPVEGLYAHEILIQDNHFEGGGRVNRKAGYAAAIWSEIFAGKQSQPLHRDIRITGNTIVDYPANGMLLVDITGLQVTGNSVIRTGKIEIKEPDAVPIRLENVFDAKLEDNTTNFN